MPVAAEVNDFLVSVSFASNLKPDEAPWPDWFEVTVKLDDLDEGTQRRAFAALTLSARRVTDMLRVTQPTSGLPGTWPVINKVNLFVDGLRRPLAFDWFWDYRSTATVIYEEAARPGAIEIRRALTGDVDDDWDLDIYVGQAIHMSRFNSDSNPNLAVFLAALVCELKIKRALRRYTPPSLQDELLTVVPERAQATVQVPRLYSSVADKFLGRSLKREHRALFGQLVCLFEKRNAFTHRAESLLLDDATAASVTARRVAMWVDNGSRPNYQH